MDETMAAPAEHARVEGALQEVRMEALACQACPLWRGATQTVFGEGPAPSPLMLVGEQPGDKEDLAGLPFVGPAGQVLDRALGDAGIDRQAVYVTNAVKHFKYLQRGKLRLHQKPATPEIRACHPWLERELDLVQPRLVVAMGATAAQSVFGKAMPIGRNRGRVLEGFGGIGALITVHPSYLLRIPEPDRKEEEYAMFVKDLRLAASNAA
jgi:DNA polymerase